MCGWADGVLVWFEIRDGRMRGWRQQRPCGAAAARRHLAGTPPGWAASPGAMLNWRLA